jgi:hypothetical protein
VVRLADVIIDGFRDSDRGQIKALGLRRLRDPQGGPHGAIPTRIKKMPDVVTAKEPKDALNMFARHLAPETPDHRPRLVRQAREAGQRNIQKI